MKEKFEKFWKSELNSRKLCISFLVIDLMTQYLISIINRMWIFMANSWFEHVKHCVEKCTIYCYIICRIYMRTSCIHHAIFVSLNQFSLSVNACIMEY